MQARSTSIDWFTPPVRLRIYRVGGTEGGTLTSLRPSAHARSGRSQDVGASCQQLVALRSSQVQPRTLEAPAMFPVALAEHDRSVAADKDLQISDRSPLPVFRALHRSDQVRNGRTCIRFRSLLHNPPALQCWPPGLSVVELSLERRTSLVLECQQAVSVALGVDADTPIMRDGLLAGILQDDKVSTA